MKAKGICLVLKISDNVLQRAKVISCSMAERGV